MILKNIWITYMNTKDLMIGDWVDVYHELPDESGFYKPL